MRRVLGVALAALAWAGAAAAEEPVAVELVLAVDRSASMTGGGLEFELRGHAAAFRNPLVAETIAASGPVAVTLVSWSDPRALEVLVPWTRVADAADAAAFAAAVDATPRGVRAGSTAIGSAVEDCAALFAANGYAGSRLVVDLVSNGFSNSGIDPAVARDRVEVLGVTVNALVLLDEFPWLESYFVESVIGGSNAFVRVAEDRDSFAGALLNKLVTEIAEVPRAAVPIRLAALGR